MSVTPAELQDFIKGFTALPPVTHTVPMKDIFIRKGRGRKDFGDIGELADSIKEVGLLQLPVVSPVKIDDQIKFEIIAGERRYRACAGLGWTDLPVYFRSDLNDYHLRLAELHENQRRKNMAWPEEAEMLKQIHAAKVRIYGEGGAGQKDEGWNIKKTAAVVSTADNMISEEGVRSRIKLSQLMDARPDIRQQIEHLPLTVALRKSKEITETEKTAGHLASGKIVTSVDIILGDALVLIKDIPDNTYDCVITDPPFGLEEIEDTRGETRGSSMTYTAQLSESDNLSFTEACNLSQAIMPELFRVLKPSSHIYIFCSTDLYGILAQHAYLAGFEGTQQLLWNKDRSTTPFRGLSYPRSYEPILFAHKPPRAKHLKDPKSIDIITESPLHSSKKIHRFQKPPALLRLLIENSTNVGDRILDPFCGSGATVQAAKAVNRSAVSFELNEKNWTQAQKFVQIGFVGK